MRHRRQVLTGPGRNSRRVGGREQGGGEGAPFRGPPCPPAHQYNAGPLPQPPHTHSCTFTHINTHSLPPENAGRGGFPNYLSRFRQMVGELSSQAPAVAPPAPDLLLLLERTPPPAAHNFAPGTQKAAFAGVNHAFRLPDAFPGTGRGVLQGESEPGRVGAPRGGPGRVRAPDEERDRAQRCSLVSADALLNFSQTFRRTRSESLACAAA